MRKILHLVVLFVLLFTGATSFAQFTNSPFQRAAPLGKARLEIVPLFSHHLATYDGESDAISNNYGAMLGIGLGKSFDVKFRYEHIAPSHNAFDSDERLNAFSIIPKLSIAQNSWAVQLPVTMYHYKETSPYEDVNRTYSIAPELLKTFIVSTNNVDITAGIKGDFIFHENGSVDPDVFAAANLGAGFSSNLNKWAIRPNVGYFFKPGEGGAIWNFGIGLQFFIPTAASRR